MSQNIQSIQSISTKDFVYILKDYFYNKQTKLCFVLGSGASVKSGIPDGRTLSKKWLDQMIEEKWDGIKKWMIENKIDPNNTGEHYSTIYDKRFFSRPGIGESQIYEVMKQAEPSFGYSIIAQLITHNEFSQHRFIVTTNFDTLSEDALFIYTKQKPFVCGHESLTTFIVPSPPNPVVAKIHRDLRLAPLSNAKSTSELNLKWIDALDVIFDRQTIPVIIGYGGNDGSLMDYFSNLNPLRTMFWCLYKDEKPGDRVVKVVNRHAGKFVKTDGFDSLMLSVKRILELPDLKDYLSEISTNRIKNYTAEIQELTLSLTKETAPQTNAALVDAASKATIKTASDYLVEAENATSAKKKKEILKEGLKKYADDGALNIVADRFKISGTASNKSLVIEKSLMLFQAYLKKIGFNAPGRKVDVKIVKKLGEQEGAYCYYDVAKNTIFVDAAYQDDLDLFFREYMHRVLYTKLNINSLPYNEKKIWYLSIESGLANYFVCSYNDSPLFARVSARKDDSFTKYDFSKKKKFFGRKKIDTHYELADIWSSIFWEMRKVFGQEIADKLLYSGWMLVTITIWNRNDPKDFIALLLKVDKKLNKGTHSAAIKRLFSDHNLKYSE